VFELDVTKEKEVEAVVEEMKNSFGRIDYMVNSAGV
jgi:NADP-dependent 3-hydroxy acid dehydrogenase YdfG